MNIYLIEDIHGYLKEYKFSDVMKEFDCSVSWDSNLNLTFFHCHYMSSMYYPREYLWRRGPLYVANIHSYRNTRRDNMLGYYRPPVDIPKNYWYTYPDKESLARIL